MQKRQGISRRDCLFLMGAGAATLEAAAPARTNYPAVGQEPAESAQVIADRMRRLKWWNAAKP